jgi:hypothetical protein
VEKTIRLVFFVKPGQYHGNTCTILIYVIYQEAVAVLVTLRLVRYIDLDITAVEISDVSIASSYGEVNNGSVSDPGAGCV